MLIIFEGCDGTGKSSLVEAVAAEVKRRHPNDTVDIIHRGPLSRPPLDEYVHDINDYVPGTGRHIIADRWHWGEEVYGPIYRDASAATVAQFRWIELWLVARGATVWHVNQPLDRLQKRLQARGEEFLQPQHVETVLGMFADIAEKSATHAATVEPEGDVATLVARIVNRAEYADNSVEILKNYPSYVGQPLPSVLLVGDKRGGKPPYVTESAFMPVNGNSGDFLLSSLNDNWWRSIGLVNGTEEGDRLPQLIEDLAGPTVVALGRDASDILLDYGIEHAGVPHPQFVRRFHNKKKLEYGILVREHARTGEMRFSWPS